MLGRAERSVAREQLGVADHRLQRAADVVRRIGQPGFQRGDALVEAIDPAQEIQALERGAEPAEQDLGLARRHHVVRAGGEERGARRSQDHQPGGSRPLL